MWPAQGGQSGDGESQGTQNTDDTGRRPQPAEKSSMKITTSVGEIKRRIKDVLRGCQNGQMDEESLQAACLLHAEIEDLQATLRLLQWGETTGSVGADGEVVLCASDGTAAQAN